VAGLDRPSSPARTGRAQPVEAVRFATGRCVVTQTPSPGCVFGEKYFQKNS
jgi:hypothetical protein